MLLFQKEIYLFQAFSTIQVAFITIFYYSFQLLQEVVHSIFSYLQVVFENLKADFLKFIFEIVIQFAFVLIILILFYFEMLEIIFQFIAFAFINFLYVFVTFIIIFSLIYKFINPWFLLTYLDDHNQY